MKWVFEPFNFINVKFIRLSTTMETVFNISKSKAGWNAENSISKELIAKAKTKREVLAKTIFHAKRIGQSKIVIFDKEGKISEERFIKKCLPDNKI